MVTISAAIFTIIFENNIIRAIFGVPTVLFIPGYVLTAALFPKKDDIENIERIGLSFGLSVAIIPLLGLVLNFTFGIRLIPILTSLCTYTIVLALAANYRRSELQKDKQFSVSLHNIISNANVPKSRIDNILTVLLIFMMILAAGAIYYVITIPKTGEKFTEFYVLNSSSGKADSYNTDLELNYPNNLTIGIVNHEYAPVNYTVEISMDGDVLTTEKLSLNNNETLEKNVTFKPNKIGSDMKLEFFLFKEDNFISPYRNLHLWVNVNNYT